MFDARRASKGQKVARNPVEMHHSGGLPWSLSIYLHPSGANDVLLRLDALPLRQQPRIPASHALPVTLNDMVGVVAQMLIGIVPIFLHTFCLKERQNDFLVGLAGEAPCLRRSSHTKAKAAPVRGITKLRN